MAKRNVKINRKNTDTENQEEKPVSEVCVESQPANDMTEDALKEEAIKLIKEMDLSSEEDDEYEDMDANTLFQEILVANLKYTPKILRKNKQVLYDIIDQVMLGRKLSKTQKQSKVHRKMRKYILSCEKFINKALKYNPCDDLDTNETLGYILQGVKEGSAVVYYKGLDKWYKKVSKKLCKALGLKKLPNNWDSILELIDFAREKGIKIKNRHITVLKCGSHNTKQEEEYLEETEEETEETEE